MVFGIINGGRDSLLNIKNNVICKEPYISLVMDNKNEAKEKFVKHATDFITVCKLEYWEKYNMVEFELDKLHLRGK